MLTRRAFNANLAATAVAAAAPISAPITAPITAKSYAQIPGANDRLNFAICGLNGRGKAHLSALSANKATARVAYICDVDSTVLSKFAVDARKELGYDPTAIADFRNALAAKDVDVITIATPDHWHAPMAIYALKAGKHVYVEKPSSHNPREGEILIESQKKHGKLVQVGDQQRSSPHTVSMQKKLQDGLIGRPYMGKAWYTNNRVSMGVGKVVPPPDTLNWDLWQGPAPRTAYKDNIHPYNWHWLFRYGTGESLNNGTHEVDVARWLLNVGYPDRVTASAGRYHFKDDWQFYDTMVTSYEYPDALISWEGRCCNDMPFFGRTRGVTIHGTTGTVLIDRGGYEVYDLKGKKLDELKAGASSSSSDLIGRDAMTDAHFANLIAAIRTGEPLHSPIDVANVAVTMVQHSNIAWMVNRELKIDNKTGRILNDPEAMKHWSRDYEKGWEVTA